MVNPFPSDLVLAFNFNCGFTCFLNSLNHYIIKQDTFSYFLEYNYQSTGSSLSLSNLFIVKWPDKIGGTDCISVHLPENLSHCVTKQVGGSMLSSTRYPGWGVTSPKRLGTNGI